MARFHIPPSAWNLDQLILEGAEAHHCLDVLRLGPGEKVTVFNGQGTEATVEITGAKKDRVELRTLQHAKVPQLSCRVTLGQAIPKGKNMELIIEKATELGASAITPLLSDRTVVQCSAGDAQRKQEKWQRVAIEAAKQCGQNWLPAVQLPQTMKEFFSRRLDYDLMLIASLQSDSRHMKQLLQEHSGGTSRVLILVGPEGDFTPAEISLAKSHGCQPVTLGPIILRTETAAIYCLSVLSHELFSSGG
jgi:16S rRNA (uracil1498-N3)-methyltransferase